MQHFKTGDLNGLATTANAKIDHGLPRGVVVDKFKGKEELAPFGPDADAAMQRLIPIRRAHLRVQRKKNLARLITRFRPAGPEMDQRDIAPRHGCYRGITDFDAPGIPGLVQNLDAQRPTEILVLDVDDPAAGVAAGNRPAGGSEKIARRQRRTAGGDLRLCGMESA